MTLVGLTQEMIAEHLDLSQKGVSVLLASTLRLDHRTTTLDAIRRAYIRHLRDQASGRAGDEQFGLTRARAREAEISADLKAVELAERVGVLVPADEVEANLREVLAAIRDELMSLRERLIAIVETETGGHISETLVDEALGAAFANLAAREQDVGGGDAQELADLSAA